MLHTKATLDKAVSACLRGEREPANDLEKYVLLRAFAAGQAPAVQLDVKAAIKASLFNALLVQSFEAAPAHVKASAALTDAWLRAAREAIKQLPEAAGCTSEKPPRAPEVDPKAVAEELNSFERDVLLEPQGRGNPRPADSSERAARIEASISEGKYGRLGRLLCSLPADEQAKALVFERAFKSQCSAKVATLVEAKLNGRAAGYDIVRELSPLNSANALQHPHPNLRGQRLCFLPVVKSDVPPAALAEGLGEWRHVELKDRSHGAYELIPNAAESEAAQ